MKTKHILVSVFILGAAAAFMSCGSASDSDSEQTNKDLRGMPASVGKNELAGRELLYQNNYEKCTVKFADNTVTIECIIETKPTDNYTRICEYTCDSKKHRFAMRNKSFDEPKYPLKDYTSYETIKETVFSNDVPETYIKDYFLTHDDYGIFEYTIDEENETISLIPRAGDTFSTLTYVDGYFGSEKFRTRPENNDLDENHSVDIYGSCISFDYDSYLFYYPASEVRLDFTSDYNFSSTLWTEAYENLGTIKGKFYKTKEDNSEEKFFLIFTSVPDKISDFKNEPILVDWDCYERFESKYYNPIVFNLKK